MKIMLKKLDLCRRLNQQKEINDIVMCLEDTIKSIKSCSGIAEKDEWK